MKGIQHINLDGEGLKICVIHTRWNMDIVTNLVHECEKTLISHGVDPKNITILDVPGAFELPYAAKQVLNSGYCYNAIICIGCLIKGETMHFEYISEAVSKGIMDINLNSKIPIIFGVLTCLTEEQAWARAGLQEGSHNHGYDWALASIEMGKFNEKMIK
jgi:6,7-dimethyl-8-ribityllumazine synthase